MKKYKQKLLIIDAHALIHRAFHALPPLNNAKGEPLNAVYGFLLILIKALKDIKPTHVAIAYDSKGKTFRHKIFPAYKANRAPTPEELISQFPIVKKMTEAFDFPTYAVPEYEADDLIGTICAQFDNKDIETIILTGDHDILQLVDEDTRVMKLIKGMKETLIYDPVMVKTKHGLTPEQIIDYKGLRGDSSDNIPGVKGIGEKGATDLLQKYGDIDGVYAHLDEITGRNHKALAGHQAEAVLSKELATIAKDAPIQFTLEDAEIGSYNRSRITKLFQQYEFKSLLPQLNSLPGFEINEGLFAPAEQAEQAEAARLNDKRFSYTCIQTDAEIKSLAAELKKQKVFAFDTETTGLNPLQDDLVGISFSWKESEGYYLACGKSVPESIKIILEDASIKKTGHNLKFDIKVLSTAGVQVRGVAFDTMIASFLINAGGRGHGLDNLAFVEYGHEMQPIEDLIGKGKDQITMADVPVEKASWYACEDADFSWRLYQTMKQRLEEKGLTDLLQDMEIPLIQILVQMEIAGVELDVNFLASMSKELHLRIKTLESEARTAAGTDFNLASSVQLKEILFEKLQLPTDKIKKTKTGYSTAAPELQKLRGTHPLIEIIEEHRELSKLTSTYVDTLPLLVNPKTGRVHTTYSQTVAATGRLASSDPNLQNIPIRTELGRKIRRAFVAPKGKLLLSLDYSQIELRVVAHLAKDKLMMKAFQEGEDIHIRTAAELNDITPEQVTKAMRSQSKAINFGILYGMGVQGIMRDSGVSRDEARAFLDKYFSVHSGIAAYIEEVKVFAHKHLYAETLFGRKRQIPDLASSNRMLSAAAERAAVNMPVQGTAADLMKLAMIHVQNAIDDKKIDALILLQVHDELVLEVNKSSIEKEAAKIKKIMESIYKLDVPLVVNLAAGTNWGEMKPLE
ncbi:MAG: DNA polymerase I [Candidatus Kerfeldbacteria bacterium CG15_BIG_FIL_POST_REV_8_21_14_020_45_12]|uniref:DNA polymerase I n=1 Tax=Candidatus Kerfeldbacteria bacterium CG15_BIG_FIL_POST_REV_8_21_14_020_45_12 TaxID=2014247 RepID=A0A2M7H331_9BACT|nr:MAG: DNA polymerase I [Candidatus Kerfeldbacteria bacterium CG15_BIG_FIL_POST_REV_8_21_14_020_45_12]PJA93304.1 MAG: DNA polymerase I [Candidatus Kerfeldbacteria bacterium CG_4_9_14_3_um_filter_45_8]